MADAAVEAAHEEHPGIDSRRGEHSGVVAGARRELDDRQPARLDRVAKHRAAALAELDRLRSVARLEVDRGDQRVEPRSVRSANVERDSRA